MTSADPSPWIERSALGALTAIGKGGQGRVWAVPERLKVNNEWPVVYKEYDAGALPGVDADQLQRMVMFVPGLPTETGRWLCENTAWPARVVCEAGQVRGFLMRRIPPDFDIRLPQRYGPAIHRPAGLQYLLNPDDYLARMAIQIDDRTRLLLLAHLAGTIQRLHELAIMVGDLSPRNLLFRVGNRPRCFFIDCDSMRLNGSSLLKQTETPDWKVPGGEELATTASDAYKFGLLAIRLFARDQAVRDPGVLAAVSPELAALARRSLAQQPQARPRLADWLPALHAAVRRSANGLPGGGPAPSRSTRVGPPQRTGTPTRPLRRPPGPPRPQALTPSTIAGNGCWGRPAGIVIAIVALLMCGANLLGRLTNPDDGRASSAPLRPAGSSDFRTSDRAAPAVIPTVGVVAYDAVADRPAGRGVAEMFARWFSAINSRDWRAALRTYDPAGVVDPTDPKQRRSFIHGMSETRDNNATLRAVSSSGAETLAELTFTSRQSPGYGPPRAPNETCTRWQVTYVLSHSDAYGYRIIRPRYADSSPC
ncbi:hypothetical protein CO540_04775 [Micromonospora sp. WMMA2032]|uniref:hypothetical protein n=1 Tax=Micromonospora sp. WMMA2032 TaxID=2039870 RepID=UPI000C0584FD|nr:hypothetical protein [Micromonospora sp. WMMA2032]ATO13224.1 hypothetical protein CO540_04775 [Micromonospora sp. WMMA2032]